MSEVDILFLGTGTSAGIPMIGCHCEVCTSADPRDKRTRPSVVISYGGTNVLVDAAPELRLQCLATGTERIEAIVFTHAHADHIMGLDDVRRFNTILRRPLEVWADQVTHQVLGKCFEYAFAEGQTYGVYRPELTKRMIDGPFSIRGVQWMPIPLFHGPMPILGFRVENVAYCTDVSRIPDESFALLIGLDVLVIDGLQFHPHPTHFSIEQALQAARRIGAPRTYLTHIAHSVSHEKTSKTLPSGVELAYDGLRVRGSGNGK